MSAAPPTRADPAAQSRVLRRLYLRLMFRARFRGRVTKGVPSPVWSFVGSLVVFALLGIVAAVAPRVTILAYSSMLHGLTFLLVGLGMATTGGTLLFSPDEADALLHRPVEPRALLAAKSRVLIMVSLALALALNAFGLVKGVTHPHGGWLFLPAHLLSVTLEVVLCAGLVVLAYNLGLRWFGRERLDNMMTMLQVGVAVVTIGGGQLIARALPDLEKMVLVNPPKWLALLPPAWFGALDSVLTTHAGSPGVLALAALAVAAPLLTAWVGMSLLAETYAQGLVKLHEAAPTRKPRDRGKRILALTRLPLLRWWLRDPVERAAFRLTLANTGRARAVKLRIYPVLVQFLIYPVFMIVSLGATKVPFVEPFALAMGAAFVAMIPATILENLRYADDAPAAEIFHCAPLARPAALFDGTRKAAVAVLCAPGVVGLVLIGLIFLRDKSTLLLLVPGLIALPLLSLFPAVGRTFIPFSHPAQVQAFNTSGCLITMVSMIAAFGIAACATAAWMLQFFVWFLLAEAIVVAVLTMLLRRSIERCTLPPLG